MFVHCCLSHFEVQSSPVSCDSKVEVQCLHAACCMQCTECCHHDACSHHPRGSCRETVTVLQQYAGTAALQQRTCSSVGQRRSD